MVVRNLTDKSPFRMSWRERKRLEYFPRHHRTYVPLLGKHIEITDSYWHSYSYREIFIDEIYKFDASSSAPFIIDCGANVGMSIIYFKYLYPDAKIIAFEPDEEIFNVLARNVKAFQLTNVTIERKALWKSETTLPFQPEGSVGSRIIKDSTGNSLPNVQTVRLRDLLIQKVDFLKIDIEGAEYEVLDDCRNDLSNVEYLFVEYHGMVGEAQTLQDILQILQDGGFRYHIKDAYPIQHPFVRSERRSGYDLQLNIFGFRE